VSTAAPSEPVISTITTQHHTCREWDAPISGPNITTTTTHSNRKDWFEQWRIDELCDQQQHPSHILHLDNHHASSVMHHDNVHNNDRFRNSIDSRYILGWQWFRHPHQPSSEPRYFHRRWDGMRANAAEAGVSRISVKPRWVRRVWAAVCLRKKERFKCL